MDLQYIIWRCVLVARVIGDQHLGDAGDLCGGLGGRTAILAGDEDLDVARAGLGDFRGRGDGVEGGGLGHLVVMFGDDENGHQITRASVFNLLTNSSTEPTLTPPWRFTGSSTFKVTRRGVTSTPSCSGVTVSIGFFLAFMMLGSDA